MFNGFGRSCGDFFSYGRFQSGGFIMMIIGFVLILVLAYFVYKKGSISGSDSSDSPLDLLQKRFVNGEIDEAEYLKKKEILKKRNS